MIIKHVIPIVLASLLVAAAAAYAQEFAPPDVPLPAEPGPIEAPPSPPDTGPAIPGVTDPGLPAPIPNWQYQRTTTNQAGTVQNTHQFLDSGDGQYQRQHVVTNPRGEMVQTWERSQNEDGYQYSRSHTFTAPDGTLLRQHEWSTTGTDPHNYTRQHEHQLQDGRTITHTQTRSWDGTAGTMVQSFTGPNGQTRQFERPWAPDEQLSPEPGPIVPDAMTDEMPPVEQLLPEPGLIVPDATTGGMPPVDQPKNNKWGWAEKLNPFRKGGPFRPEDPSPQRRAGFTVGSGEPRSTGRVQHGLNNTQPGSPSPNSRRPSWAGPQGGSPPAHASPSASVSPGRGKNR